MSRPRTRKQLIGQRFGMLLIVGEEPNGKGWKARWKCQCDCGKEKVIAADSLLTGNSASCGCQSAAANRTHGKSKTATYSVWEGMVARCRNPNNRAFHHYGGRGIKVCDRWMKFEHFLADMGERPDRHSIERKNNNLGYEPGNVKWATQDVQMRNTRRNRWITFNGETLCASDWATRLGLSLCSILRRISKWGIERALSTPKNQSHDTRSL